MATTTTSSVVPTLLSADAADSRVRRSGRARALRLYLPLGGLVLMILACFLGPVVLPIPGPNVGSLTSAGLFPFSPGHILGTDMLGNDILSRILYGGRISIEVGFGSQGVGFLIGAAVGMMSAYRGGWVDAVVMRVMDMLLSFPSLVIAITIATYFGPSEIHVIWAISFFTVPGMARLARAQTLVVKNLDYVVASRLYGGRGRWVLVRHIAINVYPRLLTFACIGVSVAIIAEAALSFLGFGVPPPAPSWGNMIAAGEQSLSEDPWLVIVPAAFLFFTVMFLNLLGDAIRDRLSST